METQSTALATREELNGIANVDPSTAWLYSGGNRISINNETRNGFILKGAEEQLAELRCVIQSASQLHSHRQPNDKQRQNGKPAHVASVEWCESKDGKQTGSNGSDCAPCPARDECMWKIEVELLLNGRDGTFLLTLPTVSSMRFKDACNKLARAHRLHFSQVAWRLTVATEKSNGNTFPVVSFEAHDMQTGETLGDAPAKQSPRIEPSTQKQDAPKVKRVLKAAPGFDTVGFKANVAKQIPYYQDKHGKPDDFHIIGALTKMEIFTLGPENEDEAFAMLQAYATKQADEQAA